MPKNKYDESVDDLIVRSVQNKIIDRQATIFIALGINLQYVFAPKGKKYSAPYEKMGRELWESFRYELYDLLCEKGQPNASIKELIEGDIRNLILGLVSVVTAKFSVETGIAVPVVALILKNGLTTFCSTEASSPPTKTVDEIMTAKEEEMSRGNKRKKPRW